MCLSQQIANLVKSEYNRLFLLYLTFILFSSSHVSNYIHFDQNVDSILYTNVNSIFIIELESNPSSGYSWKISDSCYKSNIKQYKKPSFSIEKSIPGADGAQTFYFKAYKAGIVRVQFKKVQSFNKDSYVNAEKRSFKVIIK